jgi:hypothetical protein
MGARAALEALKDQSLIRNSDSGARVSHPQPTLITG